MAYAYDMRENYDFLLRYVDRKVPAGHTEEDFNLFISSQVVARSELTRLLLDLEEFRGYDWVRDLVTEMMKDYAMIRDRAGMRNYISKYKEKYNLLARS